jgi:hypothetical protein
MVALVAVAAPVGYAISGRIGLVCVALAAGVCILAALLVLIIQARLPDPKWALAHVLAGFMLRMGIPLALCMMVYLRGGPLAEAGFVFYLLAFYLATLAAGTVAGLPRDGFRPPRKSKSA